MQRLREVVGEQVERGEITGVAVAVVQGQQTIWSQGFGIASRYEGSARAVDRQTVFRCGSISKLFTAIGAMQLVEAGRLDLDAPIHASVPELRYIDPFEAMQPITLRQLLCHRSGMVRESPVGGYFDEREPTIEATLASLTPCVLLHPPGTRTRYSNAGITIVGRAIEHASGLPFTAYQQRHILGPLEMHDSSFRFERAMQPRSASGHMRIANEIGGFDPIEAPRFELGTLPAGNLYTTVDDLARFMAMLFAHGQGPNGRILTPDSLAAMYEPQLTQDTTGVFGLGFALGEHHGCRAVQHMGAIYGFTSSFVALPEQQVGVIVLANDDLVTGPVKRIVDVALAEALNLPSRDQRMAAMTGEAAAEQTIDAVKVLRDLPGDYESMGYWANIHPPQTQPGASQGSAWFDAVISGQPMRLTVRDRDTLTASGNTAYDARIVIERDESQRIVGFRALGQHFARLVADDEPSTPPQWQAFVGSYGPVSVPLIVSIRQGHLYAMAENLFDYRLQPVNRLTFRFPPGMYEGEDLIFLPEADGRCDRVILANVEMVRRRRE